MRAPERAECAKPEAPCKGCGGLDRRAALTAVWASAMRPPHARVVRVLGDTIRRDGGDTVHDTRRAMHLAEGPHALVLDARAGDATKARDAVADIALPHAKHTRACRPDAIWALPPSYSDYALSFALSHARMRTRPFSDGHILIQTTNQTL